MAVKINALELENVKRVKAVALEPKADGLTVIGGRNDQGKTSVLDAIAWALGGEKMRPGKAARDGAANPPMLHVELSNGIVVERKGKNGALKVTDPSGNKAGQKLLDAFVEKLALDLPKFLNANGKEKAETLLRIVGVGDQLAEIDARLERKEAERLAKGQVQRMKQGAADDMPEYPGAPDEPVSTPEPIQEQQAILAPNAENQRLRADASAIAAARDAKAAEVKAVSDRIEELKADLEAKTAELGELSGRAGRATALASSAVDEPTDELERSIAEIDAINQQVRVNMAKAEARAEAERLKEEYDALDGEVNAIRAERRALLDGARMPLPGLSVEDGELVYNGAKWGDMSGSSQLRVAAAIVRELNPECGFVLVDKLEQMDPVTLAEFGAWCEGEGLQVIGTRVAVDETCTVIIEDGMVAGGGRLSGAAEQAPAFADAPTLQPAIEPIRINPIEIDPVLAPATGAAAWKAGEF